MKTFNTFLSNTFLFSIIKKSNVMQQPNKAHYIFFLTNCLIASLFLFNSLNLFAQCTEFTSQDMFNNGNVAEAVAVMDNGTIWVASDNLYYSADEGATWNTNATLTSDGNTVGGLQNGYVERVKVLGNDFIVVGYDRDGIAVSTDGGTTWTPYTSTNSDLAGNYTFDLFVRDNGQTIYVATSTGIGRTTDGGTTWDTLNNADGMITSGSNTNVITSVFLANGKIYAGTTGDGLNVSIDETGTSWTNYTSADGLLTDHCFKVAVQGDHIFITNVTNGFSFSNDGGNNWTTVELADLGITFNDQVESVTINNGVVYYGTPGLLYSTDWGATWEQYQPDVIQSRVYNNPQFKDGNIYFTSIQTLYICPLDFLTNWEIADIVSDCEAESATYDICYTAKNLEGVIGLDFDFSYPSQLSPVAENFISLQTFALDAVGGDADQIDVYENTDVAGEVSASLFFNAEAPLDAEWTGEGAFICFTFEMSDTWDGTASTQTITSSDVVESFETGIGSETVEDAKLTILTMLGQIYVRGDENTPLVNGENFNGSTEIATADTDCALDDRWTQTFNTENNGEFSIAAAGSTNLRITRNTTENDLSIIGGADALRAVFIRLGLGDAPTVNELLAMDVNDDGFASAGDITNILRRSVGLIANYPAQDGAQASDWKFAFAETIDGYEAAGEGTYDWKNVPVLPQCIAVPANPCAEVYAYDAILKGDLDNSWAATSALKTAIDRSLVVDVENKAMVEMETTYRIPIYAKDSDSFFTLDLDLPFDPSKVSIQDVVLTELGESYEIQYVWNTPEEGRLMMASYTIQEIDTDQPLFEIIVQEDITADAFGAGKSYFNGIESGVEVTGTAVGIEDILGGGHNLTAIEALHPNPANNRVMLTYNTELSGLLEVNILDLAGRTVLRQEIGQQGRAAIDLNNLQNGLYIITLSEDSQLKGREKLVIAK